MSSKNRETLKNYFAEGQLPTEAHFADLIDSMLNMTDEGFTKTVENGEEVRAAVGHNALLSFYRDGMSAQQPLWRINLSSGQNQLAFQGGLPSVKNDAKPRPGVPAKLERIEGLLYLDPQQRVGIGTDQPQAPLDVTGTVRSTGRQGSYQPAQPKVMEANGKWHPLTDKLRGCQAFEVVAGVGCRGSGRFSLLHAVVLNTYNPTWGWFDFINRKRGIRSTHAYYGRRCDRIQLRWNGTSGRDAEYQLEIRTGCDFGSDASGNKATIRAHVTQLWFDPAMAQGSAP